VPSLNIPITAEDRTRSAFNSVLRSTDKLKKTFGGLTKTLGLLAGVGGLGALVSNLTSTADRLGKVSAKLGISTTALQKFQFAGEQSGVGTETLNTALQRFTRRLEDAKNGTGPAKDAFDAMGLSFSNLDGTAKSAEEMFLEVSDAMAGMDDQSQKVALAFKLFDSEGVSLINMLQNGSGAIQEMGNQLESVGGIIDERAILATEKFNDAINLISKSIRGIFSESVLFLDSTLTRMGRGYDKIFGSDSAKNIDLSGESVQSLNQALQKTVLEFEEQEKKLNKVREIRQKLEEGSVAYNKMLEIENRFTDKSVNLFDQMLELKFAINELDGLKEDLTKEVVKEQQKEVKGIEYIKELEEERLDLYQRDVAIYSSLVDQQQKGLDITEESQKIFTNELDQKMKFFNAFDKALAQQRKRYQDIKKVTDTIFLLGIGPTSSKGAKFLREMVGQALDLAGSLGGFVDRQGSAIMQAGGASGQRAMQVGKEFATKGVEAGIMALVLSNEKVQEALGKVFDALFELIDPIIDLLAPVIESLTEILVELKPLFELFIPVLRETMVPIKGLIHVMKQVIGPIVHLIKEIAKIFTPVGTLTDALNALASPINSLVNAIKSIGGVFGGGGGGGNPISNIVSSIGGALGFADGGRVRGNRSIIVGEEGPEVFTPNQNGTIIPNHDLGGQTVVNVFLDMEGQVKLPLHQYISSVQRRAERSGNPQLAGILAG
tara:strand:- start:6442 stop:8598 length:2157 start_codon:yes stop_codon:yes gene_type:complete